MVSITDSGNFTCWVMMPSAIVFINCGGFDQSRFLDFKHGCNSLPLGSTAKTKKKIYKIKNFVKLKNIYWKTVQKALDKSRR